MKKLQAWGTVFALLLMTGCSGSPGSLFGGDSDTLTLEGEIENTIITATSTVSGQIIEMKKGLGETVVKGDVIAVIEHESQQHSVEQLQALVNLKQAVLEELKAGARPQEIDQAEAQVNAARAKLEELQVGSRPEELEQAEAKVRAAKAQYDLVAAGNRTEQIAQARNNISVASEAVDTQQMLYDQSKKDYGITLTLHNQGVVSRSELDVAKNKLDMAEHQFATSKLQLDNAKQQLAQLEKGARAQEVSIAAANYEAAKASLAFLKKGPTKQAVQAAQAAVDQAKAQLALLKNGATEQAIREAVSDLDQAKAQLRQAESKLNSYFIRALDTGIIVSKNYELGDVVNVASQIADIAANDLQVVVYLPVEHLDKVIYNQTLSVSSAAGKLEGRVSYIALEDEYLPEDKQSGSTEPTAVEMKVSVKEESGVLKSGMPAEVTVPLTAKEADE
ncbi:HlyD family secretion protein [Paenibacillus sp. BJ-4]|uniref:HlyD family secretion protein n=1 Tax=Paenibacillus sp. BJ-4 TaxID=2878097 RepID=UPI001CEFE910|nr:TolC family protein [Paenibacillus sp. BJ-4]